MVSWTSPHSVTPNCSLDQRCICLRTNPNPVCSPQYPRHRDSCVELGQSSRSPEVHLILMRLDLHPTPLSCLIPASSFASLAGVIGDQSSIKINGFLLLFWSSLVSSLSSESQSCPSMSVFTLVQRTLFLLPWKRRPSIGQGKERDNNRSSCDYHESRYPHTKHTTPNPPTDLVTTLCITTKQDPDPSRMANDPSTEIHEPDSDSEYGYLLHRCPDSSARARVRRVVNWASIVHAKARWTATQEQELMKARIQLQRCQKAWSSEQEFWLDYVRSLSFYFFVPRESSQSADPLPGRY